MMERPAHLPWWFTPCARGQAAPWICLVVVRQRRRCARRRRDGRRAGAERSADRGRAAHLTTSIHGRMHSDRDSLFRRRVEAALDADAARAWAAVAPRKLERTRITSPAACRLSRGRACGLVVVVTKRSGPAWERQHGRAVLASGLLQFRFTPNRAFARWRAASPAATPLDGEAASDISTPGFGALRLPVSRWTSRRAALSTPPVGWPKARTAVRSQCAKPHGRRTGDRP